MNRIQGYLNWSFLDAGVGLSAVALYRYKGLVPAAVLGLSYLSIRMGVSCFKRDPIRNIAVVVKEDRGFGDIYFAVKCKEILERNFPKEKVSLVSQNSRTSSILASRGITHIPLEKLQTEMQKAPHLIVQCPVISDPLPLSLPSGSKSIHLGEYSNECVETRQAGRTANSGLGKGEWGIFVPENLKDKGARTKISREDLLAKMDSESTLYSGYLHDGASLRHFLQLIALRERGKGRTVDVVIPSERICDTSLAPRLFLGCRSQGVIEQLKQAGFGRLHLVRQNLQSKVLEDLDRIEISSEKKALTLILPGALSKQDFTRLRAASEPFTIATGDQSLSEALGEVFLYEALSHKQKFLRILIQFAENEELKLASQFLKATSFHALSDSHVLDFAQIAPLLSQEGELQREFSLLRERIQTKKNLEETLVRQVSWALRSIF
jgi:hypothetical protein